MQLSSGALEAALWLLALLCIILFATTSYWVSAVIAKQPYSRRAMVVHGALMIAESTLPKIIGMRAGVGIFAMGVCALLSAGWAFRQRGSALLMLALKLIASWVALEVICAVLMLPLVHAGLPAENIAILNIEDFLDSRKVILMHGFATLGQCVLALMLLGWRRLLLLRKNSSRQWLYLKVCVRLAALVLLGGGALYFSAVYYIPRVAAGSFYERNAQYLPQVVIAAGLLLVSASYLAQDIRYIDQLRRNDTLERQQAISRSMLKNLRFFRHNMVNMLYGLEGAMLGGDTDEVRQYYREMEKRCALVNNENIIALERVTSPAVSAVLLRATDAAREREIPLSLYVQEGLKPARGLSDGELCQVLGVLLDNALEAAAAAAEPFVYVELRNLEGLLELIVKNTYAGPMDEALLRGGRSAKPGHAGVGLSSCYELLKRRTAFLNFDVSGQYVRAQLLTRL